MNQPSYNQPTIEADISVPPTTTTAASFDPFAPATPASAPRPPPPPEAFAYAPVVEYAPSTNDSSSQQLLEAKPISSNAPTWNEVMEQQQQQQHSPQAVSVQEPNTLETNPTNTRPTRPPLAASTAQEQYQLLALKRRRQRAQLSSGIGGAVVGFVFLGPLGALALGYAGNRITKYSLKRRENKIRQGGQRQDDLQTSSVAAVLT